jgi:hypothetical protein
MFSNKDKLLILKAESAAKDEIIAKLKQDLFEARQNLHTNFEAQRYTITGLKNEAFTLVAAKSYAEGQLSEARLNAEHFAGRYQSVVGQHDWHRGGSCFAHGQHYDLYECLGCRADAGTNIRLLLPEGMSI